VLKEILISEKIIRNDNKFVNGYKNRIENNKELYNLIIKNTDFLHESIDVYNRIRSVIHNIKFQPNCDVCGGIIRNIDKPVQKTCSKLCSNRHPEKKQKIIKSLKTNFGEDYSQRLLKKRQETNLERYGNTCSLHGEEQVKKKIETWIKNYSVENPIQNSNIRKKANETIKERYGVDNITYRNFTNDTIKKINDPEWLFKKHHNERLSTLEIGEMLNASGSAIYKKLIKYNIPVLQFHRSNPEKELAEIISKHTDVCVNSRKIIAPQEIDIYLPEYRLGIEFNGIYWHSELAGTQRDYHLNKTKRCEKSDVRLIHLFENEWYHKREIVLSRILNLINKSNSIGARKCNIKEISTEEKRKFFIETHIQGDTVSSINLGLYNEGILVSSMSFIKSRFNKDLQWELVRFSNKLNTTVTGGANKLFQYFIKNYNPNSIMSYSDKRWNTGHLYKKLGFKYSHTSGPNFWIIKNTELVHRIQYQKHKLSKTLKNFNPDLTAWENMRLNGYNRIWDCGNDVFVWKSSKEL
jgi:hypothetical protein